MRADALLPRIPTVSPEETANFVRNVPVCHYCPERRGGTCGADARGETIGAKASAHDCPLSRFLSRGLGDSIGKAIHALTGLSPCDGCKKRQAALNKFLPK